MTSSQTPLGSGFGPATTAADVVRGLDLSGKVAVVTGGYAGMGLEITKALASVGATVIAPARTPQRARKALASARATEVETLDLMSPSTIDGFVARFLASGRALHMLVHNAGIMAPPLLRDGRGYESQFVTNHLGHFQLAVGLWPILRRTEGARVVSVSSRAHKRAPVDFDDPNFNTRPYDPWVAYGQSKSANALFAVGADAIGRRDGVRAFAVHPGGVVTDLTQYMSPEQLRAAGAIDAEGQAIIDPANDMKTAAQGAATAVWCATSRQLDGIGGVYCENCDVARAVAADSQELLGVRPWAIDPELAERLWSLSEALLSHPLNAAARS